MKIPNFGCSGFGILVTQTDIIYLSEFVYVGMHTRTDVNFNFSSVKNTWFPEISSGTTDCYLQIKSILGYSLWEVVSFFFFPGTEKPCILKLDHNFILACVFNFAYTCSFHAVNILSIESLK